MTVPSRLRPHRQERRKKLCIGALPLINTHLKGYASKSNNHCYYTTIIIKSQYFYCKTGKFNRAQSFLHLFTGQPMRRFAALICTKQPHSAQITSVRERQLRHILSLFSYSSDGVFSSSGISESCSFIISAESEEFNSVRRHFGQSFFLISASPSRSSISAIPA